MHLSEGDAALFSVGKEDQALNRAATASQIVTAILDTYFAEFQTLRATLERLKQEESA